MATELQKQSNLSDSKAFSYPQTSYETRSDADESVTYSDKLEEKYKILTEIGHGSQGRIYYATRKSDGYQVIIKQLNIQSIKSWKEYELFDREAQTLKSLNCNGVAKFYESIECLRDNPPCSYIVQEYIPGESLQKMLNDGHRFSMDDVFDILIQTLDILSELHSHNPPVIHRDIKPSNLMISPSPKGGFKVTVIDFGAVANPQIQGGGSTMAGTYGYMPPEQLMGHPEPASDIYALAAVAVYLFSGVSPANMEIKDFRLIFEPEMQDKPHELVSVLRQMLEPKKEERLTDIKTIRAYLQEFRNGRFQLQGKTNSKQNAYSEDFEKKCMKVGSICESGNMDLWQHLPDSLPRSIPKSYDKIMHEFIKHKADSMSDEMKKKRYLIRGLILSGIIIGTFSLFVFGLNFIVLLSIGLSTVFVILFIVFQKKQREVKTVFQNKHEDSGRADKMTKITAYIMVEDLLTSGRKSIAKIVDIQYVPTMNIGIHDVNDPPKPRLYCWDNPNFRIKYAFNPPDDCRTDDIVHECIVHSAPENMYHVGDPLPILYFIKNKYFSDEVSSMPFPVPLNEILDCRELVDFSQGSHSDAIMKKLNSIDVPSFTVKNFIGIIRDYVTCPNKVSFNLLVDRINESKKELLNSYLSNRIQYQLLRVLEIILFVPGLYELHGYVLDALYPVVFQDELSESDSIQYSRGRETIREYLIKLSKTKNVDSRIVMKFAEWYDDAIKKAKRKWNGGFNEERWWYRRLLVEIYNKCPQNEFKTIIGTNIFEKHKIRGKLQK